MNYLKIDNGIEIEFIDGIPRYVYIFGIYNDRVPFERNTKRIVNMLKICGFGDYFLHSCPILFREKYQSGQSLKGVDGEYFRWTLFNREFWSQNISISCNPDGNFPHYTPSNKKNVKEFV